MPRGYDNCYKLEEYNDSKLLIQKIKRENAFYSSHSYSFKNKEYNTTEFDISKVKLEIKDATQSKIDDFCEYGVKNLNEILFPVAKNKIAFNTRNRYLYEDNEYNLNKLLIQTTKIKINERKACTCEDIEYKQDGYNISINKREIDHSENDYKFSKIIENNQTIFYITISIKKMTNDNHNICARNKHKPRKFCIPV